MSHSYVRQDTIEEWSIIFIIAAVAYIVPALIFIVFGSGDVQPWNEPNKNKNGEVES